MKYSLPIMYNIQIQYNMIVILYNTMAKYDTDINILSVFLWNYSRNDILNINILEIYYYYNTVMSITCNDLCLMQYSYKYI